MEPLVALACRWIDESESPPSLGRLAQRLGVSRWHFQRVFRRIVGATPKQYADAGRVGRMKFHLRHSPSVTQAALRAGYRSTGRFYEQAADSLAMTPNSYRRGGEGAVVTYAVARCPLGWILVAGTKRGVCCVELGDDPADLEEQLRRDFPRAAIAHDEKAQRQRLQNIVDHLENPTRKLHAPLDVQGTAFQRLVWETLRRIPVGSTKTYAQIAAELGRPNAARAVGRACATNRAAVVIPCHRAVGASGELTGYRWGVDRKRKLLQREGALDE